MRRCPLRVVETSTQNHEVVCVTHHLEASGGHEVPIHERRSASKQPLAEDEHCCVASLRGRATVLIVKGWMGKRFGILEFDGESNHAAGRLGPAPGPPGFLRHHAGVQSIVRQAAHGKLEPFGETEGRSAGTQRPEGYPNRRCVNPTAEHVWRPVTHWPPLFALSPHDATVRRSSPSC
jgi:hypothetical protein